MNAIETRALRKVYPAPAVKKRRGAPAPPAPPSSGIVAIDSLDLAVPDGEFFGVLGPNGAGKTTLIGILTTRVRITSGEAVVAGANVMAQPADVRRRIGVVPQRPNPDRSLSVIENLVFHATYFGISRADATRRGHELLERLGIADKATAKVDQLSGGQQQRLMIARALTHDPRVIFLDEPTVGLDPQARLSLWEILRELHAQGRTIVMSTHYMEEADQLCDRLAIIDQGKLLALDTPAALKAQAPGDTVVEVTFDADASAAADIARAMDGVSKAEARGPLLRVFSKRGGELIPALIDAGEAQGRVVRDIHLSRPSLETLFITLTGRKLT
ncbi:MAG TPA: ABC transporter ATP-binding protein [Thermoanaerobaculia bacterium]|jgi:ABC-2 type transport system ATP-binding protein|nr:ABC transporter ATP-binding protein [Thermoanaerobaculia bacterium]